MKTYPTYREIYNVARNAVAEDLTNCPDEWKDEDYFTELLWSLKEKFVPVDANFEWALRILREKPEIQNRNDDFPSGDVADAMCAAIEFQLLEDLRKEFGAVAERLLQENGDMTAPAPR